MSVENGSRLRVPCLQDPVGTECDPNCKNFTLSLQTLRRIAKRLGLTSEEFAERFSKEGDGFSNRLGAAIFLPKRLSRRCIKQPSRIRTVSLSGSNPTG